MTGAITWEQVASLVIIIGAIGGVWWRVHKRINLVEASVVTARSKGAHELAEFKLEVARQYATQEAVLQFHNSIDRLTDRIDRVLEKDRG